MIVKYTKVLDSQIFNNLSLKVMKAEICTNEQ